MHVCAKVECRDKHENEQHQTQNATNAHIAERIRGCVISTSDNRATIILGCVKHVITRDQAIALGTRLLEVGIGTTVYEARAINAKIGELVFEARRSQHG